MAITYPSVPCFRGINLKTQDDTTTSRSQSGRRIARKAGASYFSMTLSYPSLSLADIAPVRGAIAKARGQFETFTILLPNLKDPQGTQTANTTVAASAAVGSTSVNISGAEATNTFKAGDILGFSNHTKVYTVTDDSTASGGAATINFMPPLINSVTITTTSAIHKDVPFTVALTGDLQTFETGVNGYSKFELDAEEIF